MNRKNDRSLSPLLGVDCHYTRRRHIGQVGLHEPMVESFALSRSDSRQQSLCRAGAYPFGVRQGRHIADAGTSPVGVLVRHTAVHHRRQLGGGPLTRAGMGWTSTPRQTQVPRLVEALHQLVVDPTPIAVAQFLRDARDTVLGMLPGNILQVGQQVGVLLVAYLLCAVVVPGRLADRPPPDRGSGCTSLRPSPAAPLSARSSGRPSQVVWSVRPRSGHRLPLPPLER
jgi:hypothetical protein